MWPLQYYDSNRAFQSVGAILPSCWRRSRQRGFFCMLCVFLLGFAEQKHTQHAFSFGRERSARGWDGSIAPTVINGFPTRSHFVAYRLDIQNNFSKSMYRV